MDTTPATAPVSAASDASKKRVREDDSPAEAREEKKVKFDDAESGKQARDNKKQKRRRGRKRKAPVSVVERASASPVKDEGAAVVDEDAPSSSTATEASKGSSSSSSATLPSPPIVPAVADNKPAEATPVVAKDNTPTPSLPPTGDEAPPSPSQAPETPDMADLSKKVKSLGVHETLLAALLPSLTCQICLDLLHKPFALAPCGHTACYDCLVRWFTGPPAPGQEEGVPSPHREKTCPHCRTSIRERPVEVWTIKDLVSTVVKSGLATAFPAPPAAEPVVADHDPWKNIFPKPLSNALRRIIRGAPGDDAGEDVGLYDPADGVFRCTVCMHEIWGATCSECGRHYPGHAAGLSDGSSDGDDDDDGLMMWPGVLPPLWRPYALPRVIGHFHDEEADELDGEGFESASDGSYDGSFIDDDGGAHEVIELSSDEEGQNVRRPARRSNGRRSAPLVISDDEEEAEDVYLRLGRHRNAAPNGRRRVVDSDEEDDQLMSDGSVSHSGTRTETETNTSHHGSYYTSAGEDDEDDGSIARPPIHLAHLLGNERLADEGMYRASDAYSDSEDGGYMF